MLIRCPQCGTGFNLDADRIPSKGAKVRCSACTHTFRVRVGADDGPEYFYKKGEAPYSGETMIGAPLDVETALGDKATVAAEEKTQFGIPQRSKSAAGDYNPFPLAGKITGEQAAITEEQARNDRTQLLGSASEPEFEELDIDDLLDDDDDDDNNHTQLAPHGLAEQSAQNERTRMGAPLKAEGRSEDGRPPPLRTTEDDQAEANDSTRALGSGKLDLFDGEELPADPGEPPPIEIDPFGDAFDEPVDGGVGLLMPSTPQTDAPQVEAGLAAPSSDVSMSEEDFLLGGGTSEFGDALSLVDNSFGDDVPAFDPQSGVVDLEKRTRSRRSSSGGRNMRSDEPIELDDVRDKAPARRRARTPQPETTTRTAERPRQAARPAPAYVHQVGAPSAIRRTADVVFIALVVVVAFLAFISARAGGFIDFTNFGHMLEVAFSGAEFQPREEWKTVVEIPPPDPPPDEPLRLHNVRAIEKQLADRHLLVLAGKIRNYSLTEFKGVKIRVKVDSGGKTLVDRVVTVGQRLDLKALGNAKSVDEAKAALQKKLPDIGKEGTTYFAIVLDDVPSEVVASGNYDYSIAVAD